MSKKANIELMSPMKNDNEIKKGNLLIVINSFEDFLKEYPITFFNPNIFKNIKKDKWIIHLSLNSSMWLEVLKLQLLNF